MKGYMPGVHELPARTRPLRSPVVFYDLSCPFSCILHFLLKLRLGGAARFVKWSGLPVAPEMAEGEKRPMPQSGPERDYMDLVWRNVKELSVPAGVALRRPDFVPATETALAAVEWANADCRLPILDCGLRNTDCGMMLREALFTAYFQRGEDIGSRETVLKVAGGAGLDAAALAAALDGEAPYRLLLRNQSLARRLDVYGVPTLAYGKRIAAGAQPDEVIAFVLGGWRRSGGGRKP